MSQDDSEDIGAENEYKFDWAEFCSKLKYYYNIGNEEIEKHSRAYLMLMYEQYVELACENLGVSSNQDENDEANGKTNSKGNKILAESSYPVSASPKAKVSEETKGTNFIDDYLKDFKGVICDNG